MRGRLSPEYLEWVGGDIAAAQEIEAALGLSGVEVVVVNGWITLDGEPADTSVANRLAQWHAGGHPVPDVEACWGDYTPDQWD